MAQQDQVLKIGKQDEEENTKYSENVQEHNISGMMTNPVDTDGSPDATHGSIPQSIDPLLQTRLEDEVPKVKDNQPRRASASPQRRTTRAGLGHEQSTENSPHHHHHHHHHQARVANKGGSFSPSWERKVSSASNTPGRSRLRVGGRADESPEESSAVPKFGEWDEDNPSSADGFTGIFNKVREEKQTSATKVPVLTGDSVYLNNYHHGKGRSKRSTVFCCLSWGKK